MRIINTNEIGDQFIRESYHQIGPKPMTCVWCGQPAKYYYGYDNNDTRPNHFDGKGYCCLSCYDAYNNTSHGWHV
jgi:hypothetical protein